MLDQASKSRLYGALAEVKFAAHTDIQVEGDPNESFYVVKSGLVSVLSTRRADSTTKIHPWMREGEQQLATLAGRAYFGEWTLLRGTPANVTLRAVSDVECYRLGLTDFHSIFGKLQPGGNHRIFGGTTNNNFSPPLMRAPSLARFSSRGSTARASGSSSGTSSAEQPLQTQQEDLMSGRGPEDLFSPATVMEGLTASAIETLAKKGAIDAESMSSLLRSAGLANGKSVSARVRELENLEA